MLIKIRNKNANAKGISFTDFCQWVGADIEPAEGYFFRHDSQKNPQYEKNLKKNFLQYAEGQAKVRTAISNEKLQLKFIDKLHVQYKTLQKAFIDMDKAKKNWINLD